MRTWIVIGLSVLVGLMILLFAVARNAGSFGREEDDRFSRRHISYGYRDKAPYGSYAAFQLLEGLFKEVKPAVTTRPFAKTYNSANIQQHGNNVYLIVAERPYLSKKDISAMSDFMRAGNKIFMVIEETDSLLENAFGFRVKEGHYEDTASVAVQRFDNPHFAPDTLFTGRGIRMTPEITEMDTAVVTILGTNDSAQVNFIRINHGDGQLFVLLNPMTWTNSFLMEKDNIKALELQLSYLPEHPVHLFWDEFYKKQKGPQDNEDFSSWQVLMRHAALRWALWLGVLLLLLFVLFESKRRQRIIPEKPALANSSMDFAETLGRLYYLHHNNINLARKMSQHLMEFIRQKYFLDTSVMDAEMVTSLARKSGQPREDVQTMLTLVMASGTLTHLNDQQLQELYNSIYQFYLKAK